MKTSYKYKLWSKCDVKEISTQNHTQHRIQISLFLFSTLDQPHFYRKEHTVKLIWNGSQIHAKAAAINCDFSSKKFYKYYFRRLKPCSFITQILNSLLPIAILESVYGRLNNIQIDMIEGKVNFADCPPPKPFKPKEGVTLVPAVQLMDDNNNRES